MKFRTYRKPDNLESGTRAVDLDRRGGGRQGKSDDFGITYEVENRNKGKKEEEEKKKQKKCFSSAIVGWSPRRYRCAAVDDTPLRTYAHIRQQSREPISSVLTRPLIDYICTWWSRTRRQRRQKKKKKMYNVYYYNTELLNRTKRFIAVDRSPRSDSTINKKNKRKRVTIFPQKQLSPR